MYVGGLCVSNMCSMVIDYVVIGGSGSARDRVPSNDLPQLLSVSSSAIICVTVGPDKLSPGVHTID